MAKEKVKSIDELKKEYDRLLGLLAEIEPQTKTELRNLEDKRKAYLASRAKLRSQLLAEKLAVTTALAPLLEAAAKADAEKKAEAEKLQAAK